MAVAAAVPAALVPLVAVPEASAGNCWPWDERQVATAGDGTNASTIITGRVRLCPNGSASWWHEETIVFEQFAGYDVWAATSAVCNNQGQAQWINRDSGYVWGLLSGPYEQNCAALRKWEPAEFNVSKTRNIGTSFKWKSGNTGAQFRPIGSVYR
jgi:hypothetical protein